MKRLLVLPIAAIACATLAVGSAAASSPRAASALAEAEALLGPGAAPAAPGSEREATLVLRELSVRLGELNRTERRRARRILARPNQSGDADNFGAEAPASPVCDPNFCIHWGTAAKHAPDPTDVAPANGVPDYVDEALAAAQTSFAVENGTLGWRSAKSDGGTGSRNSVGGTGQVDIYVVDLGSDLFGYAAPDVGEFGRSRAAYLVIDDDFKGFGGSPLSLMRVTIAHEYNHILQFAYDTFADGWLFEATATWVEDLVYPAINDYITFVADFAGRPQVPLAEADSKARKIYGSSMWNHWLTSMRGAATIRDTWAGSAKAKPGSFALSAYTNAIRAAGGKSFSRDFANFAAATAEWNSSAAFPDPGLYPEMKRSGKLGGKVMRSKLKHTAYRLYNVGAGGNVKLIGKIEKKVRSAIALVARTGPATGGTVVTKIKYLGRGGRGAVTLPNAGQYARVTAVLINADGRVKGSSRRYTRDKSKFRARLGR